jgi:hypothetical protein
MKILLIFLAALLLSPALSSAQIDWQLCRRCCFTEPDQGLSRVVAPILARQCVGCRLISAAACSPLRKEANGGESVLIRYELILPGGATAVHCARMEQSEGTDWKWSVRLHPPDYGLKPGCATR